MISVSFNYGPLISSLEPFNHAAVWFSNNYGPGDTLIRYSDGLYPWGVPNAFVPINPEVRLMIERRFSNFRRLIESSVEDFADQCSKGTNK